MKRPGISVAQKLYKMLWSSEMPPSAPRLSVGGELFLNETQLCSHVVLAKEAVCVTQGVKRFHFSSSWFSVWTQSWKSLEVVQLAALGGAAC